MSPALRPPGPLPSYWLTGSLSAFCPGSICLACLLSGAKSVPPWRVAQWKPGAK
ncbi:hypothetical protein L209DRAFT_748348 [Thermothelomyces heterothallicus CBS 203.75]